MSAGDVIAINGLMHAIEKFIVVENRLITAVEELTKELVALREVVEGLDTSHLEDDDDWGNGEEDDYY